MGDIADMMLEGCLCNGCGISLAGEWEEIGIELKIPEMTMQSYEEPGYPMFCLTCKPSDYGEQATEYNSLRIVRRKLMKQRSK